jgi:hypothetical protein
MVPGAEGSAGCRDDGREETGEVIALGMTKIRVIRRCPTVVGRSPNARHTKLAGAGEFRVDAPSYLRFITKNASTAIHGRPDVARTRTVTVWLASDVKIVWRTRLAR